MITSLSHIVIFGLPLALYFGIVTFLGLLTTALLGIFVLKGLYRVPFRWHMRMAAVTIFSGVIHGILVLLLYFF